MHRSWSPPDSSPAKLVEYIKRRSSRKFKTNSLLGPTPSKRLETTSKSEMWDEEDDHGFKITPRERRDLQPRPATSGRSRTHWRSARGGLVAADTRRFSNHDQLQLSLKPVTIDKSTH